MAAISFQDSLVYLIHNANEDELPNIDREIPRVSPPNDVENTKSTDAEKKFGISTAPSYVASNSINQMWIQGAPPVLINDAAPPKSRVLDALASVIRNSLDEAKARQTKEPVQSSRGRIISRKRRFLDDAESEDKSATEWAVDHHPDDFSCSSLLPKAVDRLKKDEDETYPTFSSFFSGHRLLISALDTILNYQRETDKVRSQEILNVLEATMERPCLLSQGGPTYHAVNNNAILLAHVINKSHKDGLNDVFTRAQFEVALNLYNGSRILLEKHRGRLPHQLRCHEIPRPNAAAKSGELVIDLSNITLCRSRYCQDCVAPGINAKEVDQRISVSADKNNRLQSDAEKEFNMNDQALLLTLSRVISLEGMK